MSRLRCIVFPLLFAVVLTACNEQDPGTDPDPTVTPSAQLIAATDCKEFDGSALAAASSSSESCVQFIYDPGKQELRLTHVNAGFNCCPGQLSIETRIDAGIISVFEKEREAGCYCDCLYDLDIVIRNLAPARYRIVFIEPYRHPDDAELSFIMDLRSETSGTNCVPRTHYPWGI